MDFVKGNLPVDWDDPVKLLLEDFADAVIGLDKKRGDKLLDCSEILSALEGLCEKAVEGAWPV